MKDISRLTYQQYRAVRRMVHECCNYDGGNCLALDNGWEPCVCVQSITYSLVCKWFRAAVLPGCVPLCSIEDGRGPAPSVGRCLCRAPTVGSIVTSAPPLCAGGRKPPTNGSAAGVDIQRLESLAIRALADGPQRGADTFPSPTPTWATKWRSR